MWSQAATRGHMRSQKATWNHRCFTKTQVILVFTHNHMWHMRPLKRPLTAAKNGHTGTQRQGWLHCQLTSCVTELNSPRLRHRKPNLLTPGFGEGKYSVYRSVPSKGVEDKPQIYFKFVSELGFFLKGYEQTG